MSNPPLVRAITKDPVLSKVGLSGVVWCVRVRLGVGQPCCAGSSEWFCVPGMLACVTAPGQQPLIRFALPPPALDGLPGFAPRYPAHPCPARALPLQVKLIAEPWDIGAYMVGSFPNWDIWAEWNGKYRDDVRRFLRCGGGQGCCMRRVAPTACGARAWRFTPHHTHSVCLHPCPSRPRCCLEPFFPSRPTHPPRGDAGLKSEFATRLAGSADLYHTHNRKPFHSVNFVIAHDGFTLADMVAYNDKHNDANGEQNRERGGGAGWKLPQEAVLGSEEAEALAAAHHAVAPSPLNTHTLSSLPPNPTPHPPRRRRHQRQLQLELRRGGAHRQRRRQGAAPAPGAAPLPAADVHTRTLRCQPPLAAQNTWPAPCLLVPR